MSPSLASRLKIGLRAGLLTAAGALLCLAALVPPARASSRSDSLTLTFTPRDIYPPSSVTDLIAVPGAEGQMMLHWTAPDGNNYVTYPDSSPAAGYQIRVATFSIASIGGSTTTWWNNAMDVKALPAPAISVNPPTPAIPGTTQFLLLNQLWPGVTYYAVIVSSDQAGNLSDADLHARTPGAQANALIFDAQPPAPLNMSIVRPSSTSFLVSWSSVSVFDMDYYKIYFDSTPPYDFSHSSTTLVFGASSTSGTIAGLSAGTFVFKVTAVDRGQPRYPGIALESIAASTVTIQLFLEPQAPFGVALTSGPATATLRWMPVVRFIDRTTFAVSTAPTVNELSGYSVYRATTPILGVWNDVADVSTATLTWTDFASGPQYYYHVRAQNSSSLSERSMIISQSGSGYLVAPDDMSFFQINPPQTAELAGVSGNSDSAYLISVANRLQDLGSLNGIVMKSLEFDSYIGGNLPSPTLALSDVGSLSLHYELSASSLVTPSSFFAKGVTPSASNMSVYWFNGVKWVQMYGKLDPLTQTMTLQTKFFGQFQLRAVERTGGFSFNMAGVSNRFITPNGDGKNDNVVFTFDNPRDSAVTAKILDMRGRVVAASLPPGPVSNSLIWDGTAGGRAVPGGVYIYQIQAEGQSYSGTLVIIK